MVKKKKNQPVEAQVQVDGQALSIRPDLQSPEIDRLLAERSAESFVFIPLAMLDKKGRQLASKPRAIARKKKKLPGGQWYDGKLRGLDDGIVVPGVFAFDVRRRTAREIAEAMDVNQFIWGTHGAPAEAHDVNVFELEDDHSWQSARQRALVGLADMANTAKNLSNLQTAVEESQTTIEKFWRLVAVVLGVAIFAGAIKSALTALLGSSDSTSWLTMVLGVFFYPPVIPALFVGVYLRVLMQRGELLSRDFTAAEAEQNWIKVAPHLLALWGLCWLAVMFLTWLQSVPSTELGVLGRTDGVTTSFIICVWMLLPIAHSQGVDTLFSSAFESGITAAVSIFVIKLSLYLTNMMTDVLLGMVAGILNIVIPERLEKIINAVLNIGAEVFFVAVLLGYAWSRTRQQFMRL